MLEGRELILATRKYAKEIRWKSWFTTISTLLLLGGSFAASVILPEWYFKLPLAILTGMLIVRIFVIYHDYLHHTILRNSQIANGLFTILGLFLLAPKSIWKRSHDYHHKHNSKLYSSSIGSYPIVTTENYKTLKGADKRNYLFVRHPLTIIFGYIFAFTWGMCVLSLIRNPNKHMDSLLSLIVHYGLACAVWFFFGTETLLLSFILPSFIAFGTGTYLFYAQHNFPTVTFEDKEGWSYANAALNSSSYMKMSPVMKWFTANIGYHHIHHINSKIPFYRLPEVYKAFEEFQNPKTTSLLPWEVYRCLRLKVWDPQQKRMLTLSEIS